jgi:hypothetical protein
MTINVIMSKDINGDLSETKLSGMTVAELLIIFAPKYGENRPNRIRGFSPATGADGRR